MPRRSAPSALCPFGNAASFRRRSSSFVREVWCWRRRSQRRREASRRGAPVARCARRVCASYQQETEARFCFPFVFPVYVGHFKEKRSGKRPKRRDNTWSSCGRAVVRSCGRAVVRSCGRVRASVSEDSCESTRVVYNHNAIDRRKAPNSITTRDLDEDSQTRPRRQMHGRKVELWCETKNRNFAVSHDKLEPMAWARF